MATESQTVLKTRKAKNEKAQSSLSTAATSKTQAKLRKTQRKAHVGEVVQVVEIPADQECPLDVWSVYSQVAYVSKKEQRYIKKQQDQRVKMVLDCCPNLFPLSQAAATSEGPMHLQKGRQGSSPRCYLDALSSEGYGKCVPAMASYVMSLWAYCPPSNRPMVSPVVEKAFEVLHKGTEVYVFNEKPNSPLRCRVAIRLLRSIDTDEASIAIFSTKDPAVIDGYIPLSLVVSMTLGLEPIERSTLLLPNGKVICHDGDKRVEVSSKRTFTLHCAAPERFYVSFIAVSQSDFDCWTRFIDYFVLLNSCCRAYVESRAPHQ